MTMRKLISFATASLLACALVAPAVAGDNGTEVELTGWIADKWCGARNASAEPESVACAKACADKGSPMVLVSDGKTYELSDKKAAVGHIGHEVVVKGTLIGDDKIEVKSIEESKKA